MSKPPTPDWLEKYRGGRDGAYRGPGLNMPSYSRESFEELDNNPILRDVAFARHSLNDGSHVSPFDNSKIQVGLDGIEVRLVQGIDEPSFRRVLSRATRATNGVRREEPDPDDSEEMLKGGLQTALETQVLVFEVWGASRAVTHQLVRSRRAAFHQQSQRASWYGDGPEFRMPEPVWRASAKVRRAWVRALFASWEAYHLACEEDMSYENARYILPEGTTSYIMCEYPVREFLAVYAYRGCSMFMTEMVHIMRLMKAALLAAHPFLTDYVKISCEKGTDCGMCKGSGKLWPDLIPADVSEITPDAELSDCPQCGGRGSTDRRCTFQGWESVEGQCELPWARQNNRTFLPSPKFRIGAS